MSSIHILLLPHPHKQHITNADIKIILDEVEALQIALNESLEGDIVIVFFERLTKDEELKWLSVDDYTIIYVYDFGLSRTKKGYTAIKDYLKANNQWTDDAIICSPAEFEQCIAMVKALYANPYYQAFFQN